MSYKDPRCDAKLLSSCFQVVELKRVVRRGYALPGDVQPKLTFEIVDGIVLDDGNADFQGGGDVIGDFPPHARIERKKQPAGRPGALFAIVYLVVLARVYVEDPAIGQADVQSRPELQT